MQPCCLTATSCAADPLARERVRSGGIDQYCGWCDLSGTATLATYSASALAIAVSLTGCTSTACSGKISSSLLTYCCSLLSTSTITRCRSRVFLQAVEHDIQIADIDPGVIIAVAVKKLAHDDVRWPAFDLADCFTHRADPGFVTAKATVECSKNRMGRGFDNR